MGVIKFTMENNDDIIEFSANNPASGFVKGSGAAGFGVAPTSVIIREGAGAGGRHRSTRRGPRSILFPVLMFGSVGELENMMRRLARLMNDTYSAPILAAHYPDGSIYETEFHYEGGLDPQYGNDTNVRDFIKIALQLRSPSPYWTNRIATDYPFVSPTAGRGLIRTGNSFSKLRISSGQILGDVVVNNAGDVEAFPVWTIKGPGNYFEAIRRKDGATFRYNSVLTASNIVTVNTQEKTVVDQTGADRYTSMSTAPKLFSIPPGESSIRVYLDGAVLGTSLVAFQLKERRELVFG